MAAPGPLPSVFVEKPREWRADGAEAQSPPNLGITVMYFASWEITELEFSRLMSISI